MWQKIKCWLQGKRKVVYKCPRCLSTDLGYISSIKNYGAVIFFDEKPKYSYKFVCNNCDLIDKEKKLVKEYVND